MYIGIYTDTLSLMSNHYLLCITCRSVLFIYLGSDTEITIPQTRSRDSSTSSAGSGKTPFSPNTKKFPKHAAHPEDEENDIVSNNNIFLPSGAMFTFVIKSLTI